ncbi:ribonuclease HII [Candidatus Saccharibacteria bacterium]|nr:ribonuclease HII [Candidatus Saccharibacteria bacterium]
MTILGIDEVGRGPWAGPLVIGAVVLPVGLKFEWVDLLADSKKLTEKKREKLSSEILSKEAREAGVLTGLGWVPAEELDEIGLSNALKLAARRAVGNLLETSDGKSASFSEIIIDGTQNFLVGTEYETLVSVLPKADAKIREVSAASIIAKVARDNYMKDLATKYPEYGFEKHVGYGTAAHKTALEEFGPCPEHRRSFRPVAEIEGITTKQIGDCAETIVADYLKSQGHKILARNYKTKYYEIDIVSATKDTIYFTEVKYRKNAAHGNPLECIDQKKQKQMAFAAECFTQSLAQKLGRNIDTLPKRKLAAASVSGAKYQLEKWFEID